MTTVLLAVDDTDHARNAAAVAVDIFGRDAVYLAINVGPQPIGTDVYMWGGADGVPYPTMVPVNTSSPDDFDEATSEARHEAAVLAASAGVHATALGDVGDVGEAVRRAALEHNADVIVTGWHQRSWIASLFSSSLADDLIKSTPVPVLVVPEHAGQHTMPSAGA